MIRTVLDDDRYQGYKIGARLSAFLDGLKNGFRGWFANEVRGANSVLKELADTRAKNRQLVMELLAVKPVFPIEKEDLTFNEATLKMRKLSPNTKFMSNFQPLKETSS